MWNNIKHLTTSVSLELQNNREEKYLRKNKGWEVLEFCENQTIINKEPSKPKARYVERNKWLDLMVLHIKLMKKRKF